MSKSLLFFILGILSCLSYADPIDIPIDFCLTVEEKHHANNGDAARMTPAQWPDGTYGVPSYQVRVKVNGNAKRINVDGESKFRPIAIEGDERNCFVGTIEDVTDTARIKVLIFLKDPQFSQKKFFKINRHKLLDVDLDDGGNVSDLAPGTIHFNSDDDFHGELMLWTYMQHIVLRWEETFGTNTWPYPPDSTDRIDYKFPVTRNNASTHFQAGHIAIKPESLNFATAAHEFAHLHQYRDTVGLFPSAHYCHEPNYTVFPYTQNPYNFDLDIFRSDTGQARGCPGHSPLTWVPKNAATNEGYAIFITHCLLNRNCAAPFSSVSLGLRNASFVDDQYYALFPADYLNPHWDLQNAEIATVETLIDLADPIGEEDGFLHFTARENTLKKFSAGSSMTNTIGHTDNMIYFRRGALLQKVPFNNPIDVTTISNISAFESSIATRLSFKAVNDQHICLLGDSKDVAYLCIANDVYSNPLQTSNITASSALPSIAYDGETLEATSAVDLKIDEDYTYLLAQVRKKTSGDQGFAIFYQPFNANWWNLAYATFSTTSNIAPKEFEINQIIAPGSVTPQSAGNTRAFFNRSHFVQNVDFNIVNFELDFFDLNQLDAQVPNIRNFRVADENDTLLYAGSLRQFGYGRGQRLEETFYDAIYQLTFDDEQDILYITDRSGVSLVQDSRSQQIWGMGEDRILFNDITPRSIHFTRTNNSLFAKVPNGDFFYAGETWEIDQNTMLASRGPYAKPRIKQSHRVLTFDNSPMVKESYCGFDDVEVPSLELAHIYQGRNPNTDLENILNFLDNPLDEELKQGLLAINWAIRRRADSFERECPDGHRTVSMPVP